VKASDLNGDNLTFSASDLPEGANFDETGIFSWTPSDGQEGRYIVFFEISDGTSNDSEIAIINVEKVSKEVNEEDKEEVNVDEIDKEEVNEEDEEEVSLNLSDTMYDGFLYGVNPEGLNLSNLSVVDPSVDRGQAPMIESIPEAVVKTGENLNFTVKASDVNGDNLTFSASDLPASASFDGESRLFSWVPADGQEGLYSVFFEVSDGALNDSEVAIINVEKVDVNEIGEIEVNEEEVNEEVNEKENEQKVSLNLSDITYDSFLTEFISKISV
jgi:hypothetical protein